MAFKFDIAHRNELLTFGPRFKGEIGKDIFAAKVALGLILPIPEDGTLESGVEISYDQNIPLDQQRWFDCSSGLGVDIKKATTFDSSLENALLTYQVNNQYLITVYYFEKYGYQNLLNSGITDDTIYEAEVASQLTAALGIFESELGSLGEATLAILHGWRPASTLTKNESYTHSDQSHYPRIQSIIPEVLYDDLIRSDYPQNIEKLVEQGIAEPQSLNRHVPSTGIPSIDVLENRNWARLIGENYIKFNFATIAYIPVSFGNSQLYAASTKVIDYYLENNLFSDSLTQEELRHRARRALYPDPFSSNGIFIIDHARYGIYTDTDFFLRSTGPLPNEEEETIQILEEKALVSALRSSSKPEIWNFLRENLDFKKTYFSGVTPNIKPEHTGIYPRNITRGMLEDLGEVYELVPRPDTDAFDSQFKKDNYWVLSTSDITNSLEEGDNSVEYWRVIDNLGGTQPLIKFIEFITPSLRPGQSYKALFEINREKFDAITNGDSLVEEPKLAPTTPEGQESSCLDQNSEQAEKTFEEYKTHAIKRRRELVREIREKIQENNLQGGTIDLGGFDAVFEGVSFSAATDYDLLQRVAQALPGQQLADLLSEKGADAIDWIKDNTGINSQTKSNNQDNKKNTLKITVKELKERIDKAAKDLQEAQEVINRERIKIKKASKFDGQNEAVELNLLFERLMNSEFGKNYKNLDEYELNFEMNFRFETVNQGVLGPTSGVNVTSFSFSSGQEAIGDIDTLFPRARTNNYLSQIKDMTFFPKLVSFFDDSRNACRDLGINIDKITSISYIKKYTSGLTVVTDSKDEKSFKSWFKERAIDPLKEYGEELANTSKQNLKGTYEEILSGDSFPEEAALRALGAECDLEKVWSQVFDRLDPVSLICDYIKCLKLPAFDIRLPEFRFDPLPKVPILGWYVGFYKFLKENYEQILTRLACTISKMIIDKLAFPFCEEQLQDFIQSDIQSKGYARDAIIEALINTGIPSDKKENAKDFFDAVSNILTGNELCYILNGNMPDNATMAAIQKLAQANMVADNLKTPEEIVNFFEVISFYLPDEICEQISQSNNIQPTNCDETNSLLRSIRNRLSTGDSTLTDEEINNAVALAEKNKLEEAERLKSLFENGFSGLVPPIFDYGNPESPMPDYPERFKKQREKAAKAVFESTKTSYSQGLAQYVPAMYVPSPVNLWPYDERYDEEQTLRLESIMAKLEDYADFLKAAEESGVEASLQTHWLKLHTLYETERIVEMSGSLIPDNIKEDLEPTDSNRTSFLIPHTTIVEYITTKKMPEFNEEIVRIAKKSEEKPGVIVHKRVLKSELEGLTEDQVNLEINSLNVLIDRYEVRIGRTSGGKRDRLRAERRPLIHRRDELVRRLEEGDFLPNPEPVDYSLFVTYQQNRTRPEFQELNYEFKLIPTGFYSNDIQFNKFDPTRRLEANPKFQRGIGISLTDEYGFNQKFNSVYGFSGDVGDRDYDSAIADINQKVEDLKNQLLEILTNKPPITDELLFPGLQNMLSDETERILENDIGKQTVSQSGNETELKFRAGDIYSPSVKLVEFKQDTDGKDRYDIVVEGDFYTGLDLSSSLGPAGIREYRYCEQLPNVYSEPRPQMQQGDGIYAKRNRLKNMIISSLNEGVYYRRGSSEVIETEQGAIIDNIYKRTTETMFETLLDSLYDSYLFRATDASNFSNPSTVESLDKRITGKRQINDNCVSNRFSFGKGSVINFEKTILGDIPGEVIKEMLKPENSIMNASFDKPSAFSLAMQNLAIKGFVRTCLIDVLLKGGISYSIWDVEPVINNKFFVDYVISHVRSEFENNGEVKDIWGSVIERVVGISDKNLALETLIKEEIVKLPNYSKQIFHPAERNKNFYDWFYENEVVDFYIPSEIHRDENGRIQTGRALNLVDQDNGSYPERWQHFRGKNKFIVEHYIKIESSQLIEVARRSGILNIYSNDEALLSVQEFISLLRIPGISEQIQEILNYNQAASIFQSARVVLITTNQKEEDNPMYAALKSVLGQATLEQRSKANRSYDISVEYNEEGFKPAFALPLVEYNRKLDFNECYDISNFGTGRFISAIPYMKQELAKLESFKLLFDHIFPVRRYMAMVSVFGTSIVSGYNSMPTILAPTKRSLAALIKKLGQGRSQRADIEELSQQEFLKQLTENFPTDESNCVEFPAGFEEIFEKFFEELYNLIKQLPSVIFRGVANQIDPAYKEMRQHYINCDISQLNWRGIKFNPTGKKKLTNGLFYNDRSNGPRTEVSHLEGMNKGKYAPLVPSVLTDFVTSLAPLKRFDFPEFGERLGITILKLVTYIYSGNAPFLDPSAYFKIPCADIDTGLWRDKGKYDAGAYGRYGHPLTPFTILALSTPQLESDKRQKENNCVEQIPENDCIDPDSGEILYVSETDPLEQEINPDQIIDVDQPQPGDPDIINPDIRRRVEENQTSLPSECKLTENRSNIQSEIYLIFDDIVEAQYLLQRLRESGDTWARNVSLPYYEELSNTNSGESYRIEHFEQAIFDLERKITNLQQNYTQEDILCADSDLFIEPLADGTLVSKTYEQKLLEAAAAAAQRRDQRS